MNFEARKFSEKSYNENDEYAKNKIKKFLTEKGHKIIKEVEDYGHDLVTQLNGDKFYFELEVKRNYPFTSAADYKFDTVSFLGRKIRLHNINPFYYLILCYETSSVVYCHSSQIFKDEYKEQLNLKKRERRGRDEMYRVPKNLCGFFEIV